MGQNLDRHPHVHCIVPGGGVSINGERWIACKPNFFLSVRVLSRLFRRLFLLYLDAAFTAGELQFLSDLIALKPSSASFRPLISGMTTSVNKRVK